MEILLSFTGFHDPFAASSIEGHEQAGPILTVLAEHSYDRVFLFVTPKLKERSEAARDAIGSRYPTIEVTLLETPLADPTNHRGILRQLRKHFRQIQKKCSQGRYSISISSGTPHMHACFLLLVASGEIPARLLQTTPPQFVPEGRSPVSEIDITHQDFPQITRPLADFSESDEDQDLQIGRACRELGIIGKDPSILEVLRRAHTYAQYEDAKVLLLGETGSGKEEFARFIHFCSRRSARPLQVVNCGSIPENLVESQLFGHRRGAFTGATTQQDGKFKEANGGTIFLDELGELPLAAQAKLLRTIEQGEIEPVGASRSEKVDVRIIAATNRDLHEMVKQGQFREDLLMRFGSFVRIPALRQRPTDIPDLASHFLDRWNAINQQQRRLSVDSIRALTSHHWPGNIRELGHVIRESAMLARSKVIRPDDLQFRSSSVRERDSIPEPSHEFDLTGYLDEIRGRLIQRALKKTGDNQSQAAKLLNITPQALHQYLKRQSDKR